MKKSLRMLLQAGLMAGSLWVSAATSLGQTPGTQLRLGSVAQGLSEPDVASLERALPAGGRPWLLIGEQTQSSLYQYTDAYMPPETTTPQIRRGTVIRLDRLLTDRAKPSPWAVASNPENLTIGAIPSTHFPPVSGPYAQVAIAGRTFDQILDVDDINRPFVVTGNFDDAELLSIVSFIRSSPARPKNAGGAVNAGPILNVVRETDGSVVVWTRVTSSHRQYLNLQRQGTGWLIVGMGSLRI